MIGNWIGVERKSEGGWTCFERHYCQVILFLASSCEETETQIRPFWIVGLLKSYTEYIAVSCGVDGGFSFWEDGRQDERAFLLFIYVPE